MNYTKALKELNVIIDTLRNDLTYTGTKEDIPEGSKTVTFSYSLIQILISKLENIRNNLSA